MGDDDPYSIPNTNVLKNKLGITSITELETAERLITSVRVSQIPALKDFTLTEYLNIHKILFQDIYSWAGEPRHQMPVFTGVGSEGFKSLGDGLGDIDKTMKGLAFGRDQLAIANPQQFSEVAASVFSIINKAHIFREGNGRTQRVFLAKLAGWAGLDMDIQCLSGPAWNIASFMASLGDKSYIAEQILFSVEVPKLISIEKTVAKARLMDDYQHLELLGSEQNSASFEFNADVLVERIVTTIGNLDRFKRRLRMDIPENLPRLLMAQAMPAFETFT